MSLISKCPDNRSYLYELGIAALSTNSINNTRILNNVTRLQYSYSLFFSIKEEGELALPEEISYEIIYVA